MTLALVVVAGALIAAVNGANDVSKGVATLVGGGVTGYRRAIAWGAAWTALGGVAGALFAGAMVTAFGKGLLAGGAAPTFATAIATLLGAGAWVAIATRTGLPVSTTHAIVGALVGVATVAYGAGHVAWHTVGAKIVVPLLVSPIAALGATVALGRAVSWAFGPSRTDCLCVGVEPALVAVRTGGALAADAAPLRVTAGAVAACEVERPAALRLTLDHLHWLSSGATSFARAMNDAPKIAALTLAAAALAPSASLPSGTAFAWIAAGMVAGSLAGGLRVTRLLAEKVTAMDSREGLLANLVTSSLVAAGAIGGLPMSTTHVSSCAIIGAGVQRGGGAVRRETVKTLLLAWTVTLPAAAALGVAALGIVRALG